MTSGIPNLCATAQPPNSVYSRTISCALGGGILNDGTLTLTEAAVTGNASGVPSAARGPTSRNELHRPDRRSQ